MTTTAGREIGTVHSSGAHCAPTAAVSATATLRPSLTLGMAGEIDTGIAEAVEGPARPRLFLGRNRFTARRYPAAMGSPRRKSC